MKKRNYIVMSGIAAMCAIGFGLNVSANTIDSQPTINLEDTTTQATTEIETTTANEDTTTPTSEDTTNNDTTTFTCPNNHENCDGMHADGECPYGNEPGSGLGYHHGNGQGNGNGLHDGSHAHQQLHDGSGRANGRGYQANTAE